MHTRVAFNTSVISPEDDDLAALHDALRVLEDAPDDTVLLGTGNGANVNLPASAVQAIRQVINVMAHDTVIVISEVGKHLTFNQVAGLLNLPISHVSRILDNDELAVVHVDGIPLVAIDDLLAFIRARSTQREEALNELTRLSEELGLYDLEE